MRAMPETPRSALLSTIALLCIVALAVLGVTLVAREVGAGGLAIAAGLGAWISAVVVGVWTQVVPATWWLLRRLADPDSRSHGA